jgi:hypothetical protein
MVGGFHFLPRQSQSEGEFLLSESLTASIGNALLYLGADGNLFVRDDQLTFSAEEAGVDELHHAVRSWVLHRIRDYTPQFFSVYALGTARRISPTMIEVSNAVGKSIPFSNRVFNELFAPYTFQEGACVIGAWSRA